MSNPSSWFGIHAQDLDRAKAFYESVFGKPLQDIGGNGFRFIISPADYTQHGTAGMIWHDSNAQPGHGGTTIFFNCPDCTETAEKAVSAGGKLLQGKFPIANGFAAFIEDTEGNRIGLHSTR